MFLFLSFSAAFSSPTGNENGTFPAGRYEERLWERLNTEEHGGAVFYLANATLDLVKCRFIRCTVAMNGGAVCTSNCLVNISSSEFEKCMSFGRGKGGGGGIQVSDGSLLTVNYSVFNDCYAGYGGAVFQSSDNTFGQLVNCNFSDCRCNRMGGAFRVERDKTVIENCSFTNCIGGNYAGAICTAWSSCELDCRNCRIIECRSEAWDDNTGGGAFGCAGTITLSNVYVQDCYSTVCGGAFLFFKSDPTTVSVHTIARIYDSVITDCSCSVRGGGIYMFHEVGELELSNVICKFCTTSKSENVIYVERALSFNWSRVCIIGYNPDVYSCTGTIRVSEMHVECPAPTMTPLATQIVISESIEDEHSVVLRLKLFVITIAAVSLIIIGVLVAIIIRQKQRERQRERDREMTLRLVL